MDKNLTKRILLSSLAFIVFGMGVSIQIKANIGQSIFTALAVTISSATSMEVGTITNLLNLMVYVLYILFKKSKFSFSDILLVVVTLLNGVVINFFVYSVFGSWEFNSYFSLLITYLLGLVVSNIALGMLLSLGLFKFPLESLCIELVQRTKFSLKTIRYAADVIFVVITLALTFLFKVPLTIREGTVISLVFLSPLMGYSYDFFKKFLGKWNLSR